MVEVTTDAARTLYTARAQRADGWWAISVAGLPGAHTQARRLDQAQKVARELISMILDVPADSFDVQVVADLEEPAKAAMDQLDQAKANYEKAQEAVAIAQREVAAELMTQGLTVRDAGEVMGISFQRVSQLNIFDVMQGYARGSCAHFLPPAVVGEHGVGDIVRCLTCNDDVKIEGTFEDERWPAVSNLNAWTKALRRDYLAYSERMEAEPAKRAQFSHQRDIVVHELVRRLNDPQRVATVLSIPVSEVEGALQRPGLK